jgi:predicted RNase H-like HicB family nuclease
MKLTVIIENDENGWFTGHVEEIPEIMSKGKSVLELKARLVDALYANFEAQKKLSGEKYKGKNILREELILV